VARIEDIEKLALELPETERATLITHLLQSLPPILIDDDGGIAEALRRDAEMDEDPTLSISLAELDRQIKGRKR
jgi:hypothetical protein